MKLIFNRFIKHPTKFSREPIFTSRVVFSFLKNITSGKPAIGFIFVLGLIFAPANLSAQCVMGPYTPPQTGCPAAGAGPPNVENMTHFYNWTGNGGYQANTSNTGSVTIAGIPAGSTIIKAFLWTVQETGSYASCLTSTTFNATGITGTTVGQGDYQRGWVHPVYGTTTACSWGDYWCNTRYDVTALVAAPGNGVYSIGAGFTTYSLVIVYRDASTTDITTVALVDGLYVWHVAEGTYEYGFPPQKTNVDWSCQGNPVCSVPDTKFSRIGGSKDMESHLDTFTDQIVSYGSTAASPAVVWQSPPGVLTSPGPVPWADIDTYYNPAGAFTPGQTQFSYDMGNALGTSKTTHWVNVLAFKTTCPVVPVTPTISKSADVASQVVGGRITYTLTYSNPPSKGVTDTHNDNDGNYPPVGWSQQMGNVLWHETATGYVVPIAGGTTPSVITNGASSGNDGLLQIRVSQAQWQTADGIAFRWNGSNGYTLRVANGAAGSDILNLYRDGTLLTSWTLAGDVIPNTLGQYIWLQVNLQGCNFTVAYDAGAGYVTVGSASDCTYASGSSGYYQTDYNPNMWYDEFRWSACNTLTNVVVTDTLDSHLTYGGPVGVPAPTSGPNPLLWNLGSVTCAVTQTLKFWVTVASAPASCVIPNQGAWFTTQFGTQTTNIVNVTITGCGSTPTFTNTATKTPSNTPTPTPTNTPTRTPTVTPTNSPSNTPTNSPTITPTNSPTVTPTNSPTVTPTNSPTRTATNTNTNTATLSPTNTATVTTTNSATNSPTRTPTTTPTNSPTNTLTNTATLSPTNTATVTTTNTATVTTTNSPTRTPTTTPSNSPPTHPLSRPL